MSFDDQVGLEIEPPSMPKLNVGTWPGRKRPSLNIYTGHGYGWRVLASFRDDNAAIEFQKWLVTLLRRAGAKTVHDTSEVAR